jgi:hypothetical protein
LRELLNPLDGTPLDPRYGIVPIATFWHPAAGGYVVYRYVR